MAYGHLAYGLAEGRMKPIVGLYGIQDRQDDPHPLETHDHAICRIEEGRVVRHLALERWTRRKHDNRLHAHIEELASLGFLARGEQAVLACADSFVGRAFVSQGGRWRVEAPPADELAEQPVPARAHVMGHELEAWVVPHELAHLSASLPFLGVWEDGTLLVHMDGAASRSCCSAWLWRGGHLRLLHHGWDLSEPVAGFGANNLAQALVGHTWQTFLAVPGKLMGLAAWGRPDPEIRAWLDRHSWFARLPGGSGSFEEAARIELRWDGQLSPADPLIRTIAACFQERFEDAVAGYVERFAVETGARRLVLAGGGALNLRSNQRIADAGWFDHVFVPPCAGDDGLALGAAALMSLLRDGPLATHGPFLNDVGAPALGDPTGADLCAIADAIAAGRVVGTCLGAAEIGPRALGHRSLFVRPTEADAKRLSVELKGREPWRPVAPLVLAELADGLFEGTPSGSALAEYMLGRFVARPTAAEHAPGVVHADGTARVQVIGASPDLRPVRRMLEALWERHRIPCVVNTSFNCRGEPLVQTLAQARDSAARMGVDLLWHAGGVEPAQRCPSLAELPSVSAELVSWRADAVHASVEVGLLDALPLDDTSLDEPRRRLLAALGEMALVSLEAGRWTVTPRGALLRRDHPSSLAPAARYWAAEGRAPWRLLVRALQDPDWKAGDPFAAQAHYPGRVRAYHAAISVYARHDYAAFPEIIDSGHSVLVDAGGALGDLAIAVLRAHPEVEATVLDRPEVVAQASAPSDVASRLRFQPGDLFEPWNVRADAIVLARVLHDWPDARAALLLERAREALMPNGRLYIVEMVRPEAGFEGALLDLHMLLATGGRERTRPMFRALLRGSGLRLVEVRPLPSVCSVVVAEGA